MWPSYHFASDLQSGVWVKCGKMDNMRSFLVVVSILFFLGSPTLSAQELVLDTQETVKARVVEVVEQETRTVPGTDTETDFQTLRVEVLEGPEAGKTITVENDFLNLEEGEVFSLMHTTNGLEGIDLYSVME